MEMIHFVYGGILTLLWLIYSELASIRKHLVPPQITTRKAHPFKPPA